MFNNRFNSSKNDPLVEAVKQAQAEGDLRRQAIAAVNEQFGVFSRNAVVREDLAAYDAAIEEAVKCMKEGKPVLAKKDHDGDGKIESEKDEVWGSRFAAAKRAGKMEEGSAVSGEDPGMEVAKKAGAVQQSQTPSSTPARTGNAAGETLKNTAAAIREAKFNFERKQKGIRKPTEHKEADDYVKRDEKPSKKAIIAKVRAKHMKEESSFKSAHLRGKSVTEAEDSGAIARKNMFGGIKQIVRGGLNLVGGQDDKAAVDLAGGAYQGLKGVGQAAKHALDVTQNYAKAGAAALEDPKPAMAKPAASGTPKPTAPGAPAPKAAAAPAAGTAKPAPAPSITSAPAASKAAPSSAPLAGKSLQSRISGLAKSNKIANVNKIYAGKTMDVGGSKYTIQKGDTLTSIAKKFPGSTPAAKPAATPAATPAAKVGGSDENVTKLVNYSKKNDIGGGRSYELGDVNKTPIQQQKPTTATSAAPVRQDFASMRSSTGIDKAPTPAPTPAASVDRSSSNPPTTSGNPTPSGGGAITQDAQKKQKTTQDAGTSSPPAPMAECVQIGANRYRIV